MSARAWRERSRAIVSTTQRASSWLVAGAVEGDRLAAAGVGPESLAAAQLVVRDHRVGGVEDRSPVER